MTQSSMMPRNCMQCQLSRAFAMCWPLRRCRCVARRRAQAFDRPCHEAACRASRVRVTTLWPRTAICTLRTGIVAASAEPQAYVRSERGLAVSAVAPLPPRWPCGAPGLWTPRVAARQRCRRPRQPSSLIRKSILRTITRAGAVQQARACWTSRRPLLLPLAAAAAARAAAERPHLSGRSWTFSRPNAQRCSRTWQACKRSWTL
jgi:hypothetical protein